MKRTITTIVTAILMTLSFSSFAKSTIKPEKAKAAKEILINYIETTTIGRVDFNKSLFTEDFTYENTYNNCKHHKKDYLKFLKQNKGLTYNCTTKFEILDTTQDITIAKTTQTFETFTRVDHITMINSKDGWKINSITTSYL